MQQIFILILSSSVICHSKVIRCKSTCYNKTDSIRLHTGTYLSCTVKAITVHGHATEKWDPITLPPKPPGVYIKNFEGEWYIFGTGIRAAINVSWTQSDQYLDENHTGYMLIFERNYRTLRKYVIETKVSTTGGNSTSVNSQSKTSLETTFNFDCLGRNFLEVRVDPGDEITVLVDTLPVADRTNKMKCKIPKCKEKWKMQKCKQFLMKSVKKCKGPHPAPTTTTTSRITESSNVEVTSIAPRKTMMIFLIGGLFIFAFIIFISMCIIISRKKQSNHTGNKTEYVNLRNYKSVIAIADTEDSTNQEKCHNSMQRLGNDLKIKIESNWSSRMVIDNKGAVSWFNEQMRTSGVVIFIVLKGNIGNDNTLTNARNEFNILYEHFIKTWRNGRTCIKLLETDRQIMDDTSKEAGIEHFEFKERYEKRDQFYRRLQKIITTQFGI